MTLIITPYCAFDLGTTPLAKSAVENYKFYKKTAEYSFLKKCFSNLHNLVTENPDRKIVAAKASDALARKTFDVYDNIYVKFFISISADSICVRAQLEESSHWIEQSLLMLEKIKEGEYDDVQAEQAGLAKRRRDDPDMVNFVIRNPNNFS